LAGALGSVVVGALYCLSPNLWRFLSLLVVVQLVSQNIGDELGGRVRAGLSGAGLTEGIVELWARFSVV